MKQVNQSMFKKKISRSISLETGITALADAEANLKDRRISDIYNQILHKYFKKNSPKLYEQFYPKEGK
jgi:hypothetical protein